MPQFSIHQNLNPASKKLYPYLVNVQSTLLDVLDTRLVIPLTLKARFDGKPIKGLNPVLVLDGDDFIILTQQMAAIHLKNMGPTIFDGSENRQEILSAIDLLITGF
jgi:toxin CcdB